MRTRRTRGRTRACDRWQPLKQRESQRACTVCPAYTRGRDEGWARGRRVRASWLSLECARAARYRARPARARGIRARRTSY